MNDVRRFAGAPERTHWPVSVVVLILRILVGGVLLVTGTLKVGHSAELAAAIAGFRLLPAVAIEPLALSLPFFELLLGGYLIAGLLTRAIAVACAVQFAIYAAAIASAIVRHIPANCGCFGPNDNAVADWPHVGFDVALMVASALVAYRAPGALALDWRFLKA